LLVTGISLASCCRMQIHEETFMAKFLSIVISVFLLSACATVTEDNGSQVATQELPTPGAEIRPVESNAPAPAEPARNEVARKIPTKQEIKLIQAQLKAAGFDPGPVDGTLGAKTTAALGRLQSGCANLKDLFENPTSGILQQPGAMQAGKQGATTTDSASNTDEIRLIQVRLKDAGFDVGPVDGVMGSKTKSGLLRFQSGCTMVKEWSAILENQVQMSDRMPSPMPASEKQLQPAPSKASPAIESVRDEAGKMNAAAPSKEEIRLLQAQLKAAGFDPGPFDGMLGPKTKSALQQYRTVNGSLTSQKLSSSMGIKFDY
jgi:peptidoglycan hydrolase-like protein with peptidoglycan-binding domain